MQLKILMRFDDVKFYAEIRNTNRNFPQAKFLAKLVKEKCPRAKYVRMPSCSKGIGNLLKKEFDLLITIESQFTCLKKMKCH